MLESAVLLDLDGTLVDTEPLWYAAEELVASELGWSYTGADHAALIGVDLRRTAEYLRSRASRGRHTRKDIEARLMAVLCQVTREYGVTYKPGAEDLLAGLDKYAVPHALVTSSTAEFMYAVLAARGLEFAETVCAGDTARHKPDPAPYQLAAWRLGADPRDCAAVEDSPAGAASAEEAGCKVYVVQSGPPVTGDSVTLLRSLFELTVTSGGLRLGVLDLRP